MFGLLCVMLDCGWVVVDFVVLVVWNWCLLMLFGCVVCLGYGYLQVRFAGCYELS